MPATPAKVVTIITAFEARQLALDAFADLGVRGFSEYRVEGVGVHGAKRGGLVETENFAFVIVASEALSVRLLTWVEERLLSRYPCIAYSTDAVAVAAGRIG